MEDNTLARKTVIYSCDKYQDNFEIKLGKMVYEDIGFNIKKNLTLEDFDCKGIEEMVDINLIKSVKYKNEGEEAKIEFHKENPWLVKFNENCNKFINDYKTKDKEIGAYVLKEIITNLMQCVRIENGATPLETTEEFMTLVDMAFIH